MSSTAPSSFVVRRDFWEKLRTESLSDWQFAWWRELVQNATDAGADRVDITLDEAPGRGAFGREAEMETVIRVGFADNGHGMTEEVLRNVFLDPGQTTKVGGDTIGGFGTARVMLCFSQVRYGIRTENLLVEGTGSEYVVQTVAQAREGILTALEGGPTPAQEQSLRQALASLEADAQPRKGVKFEIDIAKDESSYYRRVTVETLRDALKRYLSFSQLPLKVFLNGEEMKLQAKRGPVRRQLVAENPETGAAQPFATVHTSQGDKARHKGQLIVRVNGATMYHQELSGGTGPQVIVELDPKLSRLILTDRRDSMKWAYRRALDNFVQEISVDKVTALKTADNKVHTVFRGGKGSQVALTEAALKKLNLGEATPEEAAQFAEEARRQRNDDGFRAAREMTRETYEEKGFAGIAREHMDAFFTAVAEGQETILNNYPDQEAVAAFARALREHGALAIGMADEELASYISAAMSARVREAGGADDVVAMADSHDIHIYVEDKPEGPMKNAVKRHRPTYWRHEGKGLSARMTLAAWDALVANVLKLVAREYPEVANDKGTIPYATGFGFANDKEGWIRGKATTIRTEAMYKTGPDGTHVLLINPVTMDGHAAYDLTIEGSVSKPPYGLAKMAANAVHEAAHILCGEHGQDFAYVLTHLTAAFLDANNQKAVRADIKQRFEDVLRAYGRGTSRVQFLDDQDQEAQTPTKRAQRPAMRLMAQAAPLTMLAAGIVAIPENDAVEADHLKVAVEAATLPNPDGTVTVDCEVLQRVEKELVAEVKNTLEQRQEADHEVVRPAPAEKQELMVDLSAVPGENDAPLQDDWADFLGQAGQDGGVPGSELPASAPADKLPLGPLEAIGGSEELPAEWQDFFAPQPEQAVQPGMDGADWQDFLEHLPAKAEEEGDLAGLENLVAEEAVASVGEQTAFSDVEAMFGGVDEADVMAALGALPEAPAPLTEMASPAAAEPVAPPVLEEARSQVALEIQEPDTSFASQSLLGAAISVNELNFDLDEEDEDFRPGMAM